MIDEWQIPELNMLKPLAQLSFLKHPSCSNDKISDRNLFHCRPISIHQGLAPFSHSGNVLPGQVFFSGMNIPCPVFILPLITTKQKLSRRFDKVLKLLFND
jgi:hypothetical protein